MAKLAKLQASVENVIYSDGEMEVLGEVPFDTAKEFQVDLRSMTDGKGFLKWNFWNTEGQAGLKKFFRKRY